MHLIVPFCPALLAGAEEDSTRCSLILGVIKNEHQPSHLPPSLAVSTPLVQWSQPVLILCSVYSFFPCFFFFDHTSYPAFWIQWEEYQGSLFCWHISCGYPQVRGWELACVFVCGVSSNCGFSN